MFNCSLSAQYLMLGIRYKYKPIKYSFKCFFKAGRGLVSRIVAGRLFQVRGPATWNSEQLDKKSPDGESDEGFVWRTSASHEVNGITRNSENIQPHRVLEGGLRVNAGSDLLGGHRGWTCLFSWPLCFQSLSDPRGSAWAPQIHSPANIIPLRPIFLMWVDIIIIHFN